MNIDNINRVIEALEREREAKHETFMMGGFSYYIGSDDGEARDGRYHGCNTALCIAGWANTLQMSERTKRSSRFSGASTNFERAQRWLGLREEQAWKLFYMGGSIMRLSEFDYLPAALRYHAGIRVLQILRETGKVDWLQAMRCAGIDVSRETQGV